MAPVCLPRAISLAAGMQSLLQRVCVHASLKLRRLMNFIAFLVPPLFLSLSFSSSISITSEPIERCKRTVYVVNSFLFVFFVFNTQTSSNLIGFPLDTGRICYEVTRRYETLRSMNEKERERERWRETEKEREGERDVHNKIFKRNCWRFCFFFLTMPREISIRRVIITRSRRVSASTRFPVSRFSG